MKLAMILSIVAISLGAQLHYAVADEVPTYDARKSCKNDLQASQSQGNPATCLADEQNARATLVDQWTQFAPQTRSHRWLAIAPARKATSNC